MLFLVISHPAPSKPDLLKEARIQFTEWINGLKRRNKVMHFYPRVGRGAIVIFSLETNEELHGLLTEWLNLVPASFDVYPLVDPSFAQKYLHSV